jgi:hypothetical protein
MKYNVSASVNVRRYAEELIEADSEDQAKELFIKRTKNGRIEWEDTKMLWDSLEIFADCDKPVKS